MRTKTAKRSTSRLDGVFIAPGDNLAWSKARWRDAIEAIAAAGVDIVILQRTGSNGRVLYPSRVHGPMPGMGAEDVVEAVLAAAEEAGLSVILGLDATRHLADIHYDPIEPQADRTTMALMEVLDRHGDSASLRGFYLPQEWSAPPTPEEAELITQCATICRRLRPDLPVCTTAPQPKLPVTGRGWELLETDPEALARQRELIERWAQAWAELAERARLGAVMVRDDAGSRRCTLEASADAYEAMRYQLVGLDSELWAQVGLYEVTHRRGDSDPSRLHSTGIQRLRRQLRVAATHCHKLFGFSFEYMDPAAGGERAQLYQVYRKHCGVTSPQITVKPRRNPRPTDVPDPLLEKAMAVERIIEQRHVLEGQIMTVVDYRFGLDDAQNLWQEDADFMTGLYVGAESLRFAATGDPDARARARRSFEALCMLSTVSGVPGVVARSFRRSFTGDLGAGRKRWQKVEGEDLWWATDISRDQLSGHFFGLAAYYDLVADESERKLIRRLVCDIVGSILDHRMQAVDWDGGYTIHGNFWVAPFQALAVLKLAYRITRQRRFQQAYLEYISPHFFLGHAIVQAAAILDPFFQHYQYDSPAYHLLQYETNPDILRYLLRALDLLYAHTRDFGNVYLCFVYQTYRPESDAARRGEAELLEFEPQHLHVPNWRRDAERFMRERGEELPSRLYDTLCHCLDPSQSLSHGYASFIPMRLRPPMQLNWQYYAGIQTPGRAGARPHGPHVGYTGVDYLLAYWMGRYHGFLR